MKSFFLLVVLLTSLLFANSELDIDSYITKIKEAAPEERVKLMNEFKQKIAQMNKEERLQSIKKMQTKMQVQTQHNSEISTHQNMNHNQAGYQAKKQFTKEHEHMSDVSFKEHK